MVAEQRFFIIGAQRAGTTLLHHALSQHPDVAMHEPVRPEPKHFLRDGSEQITPGEYDRRYFRDRAAPVRGEKGTSYIEFPISGHRILRVFPQAKFLVMVRDPVDRALSNYRFSVEHGLESLPPNEALTPAAEGRPWRHLGLSASPFAYLRRGRYALYLDAWADAVGRDRIMVARLEGLEGFLPDIQWFLGLRPHHAVRVSQVVNASSTALLEDTESIRRRLKPYYRESNARLASEWGTSVQDWLADDAAR